MYRRDQNSAYIARCVNLSLKSMGISIEKRSLLLGKMSAVSRTTVVQVKW
jgi:hypothetical protein